MMTGWNQDGCIHLHVCREIYHEDGCEPTCDLGLPCGMYDAGDVHCSDCTHCEHVGELCHCERLLMYVPPRGFCWMGEGEDE